MIRFLPVLLLIGAVDAVASFPSGPYISITPSIGRPAGGEVVRIQGSRFDAPVRVFFTSETGVTMETFVVSQTTTHIDVVTPSFALPAGRQSMTADIRVIVHAGSVYEMRADIERAFAFRKETLTPLILTITPNRGSLNGEARVTIFGEGFQAPVQVFLFRDGDAAMYEMRVIAVDYEQIVALVPPAGGLPPLVPLHLRIVNLNSNTQSELRNAFRYMPSPVIENVSPARGPQTGGTRIRIDGVGFEAPLVVNVAGVDASPIFVSGTRIEAITSPLPQAMCDDVTGPIVITNILDGAQAIGGAFTYRAPRPHIERVPAEPVIAGGTIDVKVASDIMPLRFTIGGVAVVPVDARPQEHVWTLPVPATLTFPRELCFVDGEAGKRFAQQTFELVVRAESAGCKWEDVVWISVLPSSTACIVRARPSNPGLPPHKP